ncbi:LPS translocon maturation chaperone LptM [Herbaspirillum rhizosphaerae]|uniref:LPS translocon maturation chaperone LptM n=1 Tax=Herbaspirillum rhizosphaerae TaxID=346179 RepID=UPI0009F86D94|nr:lipoprotein [Herbaspirillum rhizosphaerae]
MKSPFHFSPARPASLALSAVALLVLLSGCGQKGPLYLPKPPAEHPVRTAPTVPGADAATDNTGAASSNTAAPQSK